jgi:SAM-dependent methyltransferase
MHIINPEGYQQGIEEAQKAVFAGWDFRWLAGRMIQPEPNWDYPELVRTHLEGITHLLDMGTGGGEFLASLMPLPADTHATEAYPPNQPIAQKRLTPLGAQVHFIDEGQKLPFADGYFDLVIDRHESFDPQDVFRVLKPGGMFITQQVGGLDNLELNQVLEDDLSFPFTSWSLTKAFTGLYESGFRIERAEKTALPSIFKDIGAVVYYLKAIPWQVEGFSPETHAEGLKKLHNLIENQSEFIATAHRFLIIAQKPESAQ